MAYLAKSLVMHAFAARAAEQGLLYRLKCSAWYRMPRPFTLPWLLGTRLLVEGHDEALRTLFLAGHFEPEDFRYLDQTLKPGMTFIDCGANLGLYTLFASRKVGPRGSVVAIEPSSREFGKLRRNVELNGGSNVHLVRKAVSDSRSVAHLQIADDANSGHNTLHPGTFFRQHNRLETTEEVETETLDRIVCEQKLISVDVIKIDVERAEFAVLQGARQTLSRYHPSILAEVSTDVGVTTDKVFDMLAEFGYKPYVLGDLIHPTSHREFLENVLFRHETAEV